MKNEQLPTIYELNKIMNKPLPTNTYRPKKASQFKKDLTNLINVYSRENKSNTPDFILAEYMEECLLTFERIIVNRDKWHDFESYSKCTCQETIQNPAPNIAMDEFFIKD